jgi:agmatinase
MADTPTFATSPGFLGITRHDRGAAFCVAGIPFDIGTTNRAGTRFGPRAIRQASAMLVDGDHPHWRMDPAQLSISDIGDFAIALGDIPGSLKLIEEQAAAIGHLIALGGEHGITLPLLRALRRRHDRPLGLVHFDAHVDTWPDNFGQKYAHGSVFFHAIEEKLIDPARTIQVGIRSPVSNKVRDWTTGKGVTIVDAMEVHGSDVAALAQRIASVVGPEPCYLSFDIDVLDPAFAPGTGTPEIGGLASWQAQAIIRRLGGLNFAGMDVVEVSPPYDHAEITSLAGATMAWEYLALVGSKAATAGL